MRKAALMAQKLYRGKRQRERFAVLKEEMAKRAEIERASKERAKAKQQREEQERTSRAVAGVNHLEIPAELAFIYSKLDGSSLSLSRSRTTFGHFSGIFHYSIIDGLVISLLIDLQIGNPRTPSGIFSRSSARWSR